MKIWIKKNWVFLTILTLLSAYALWGIPTIPFHPDESTQLYMSGDVETFFTQPLSLTWNSANRADPKQRYHTLDAPLPRYIIGFGRLLNGQAALPVDWDWSKSWQENEQIGALPTPALLTTGRIAITLLLPMSLLMIYQIGKTISGSTTALLATLLLGSNALILLHTRRAMAEGALTLGILIAIWSFLGGNKRPWLAGLCMALAFCAKQSTLALLPAGWLAVCWEPSPQVGRGFLRRFTSVSFQYFGVFLLVVIVLNPFLWADPLNAVKAAWQNREDLLTRQVGNTTRLTPDQVLSTPGQRSMVLLANLYFTPPSFWEIGNYLEDTASSENDYLMTPGHTLMRNNFGGIILFSLTLVGLAAAGLHLRRISSTRNRIITILLLVTLLQVGALIATIPLPWQRYVIPLVPLSCLWIAYAIGYPLDQRMTRQTAPL